MADKFHERLRSLLELRGVTQKALSDMTGVTQSSVSHYIKGDRVPTSDTVAKIARALGTTPDFLLFGEPFTEDEKLNDAVDMVTRNSVYLSREQKVRIIESLVD